MNDNVKYVITLAVAVVIPALSYSYSQGTTNATMVEMNGKIDNLTTKITKLSDRTYSFNGAIAVNQHSIEKLEEEVKTIKEKLDDKDG